jgi:transcriptional regulator of arginine metabolism
VNRRERQAAILRLVDELEVGTQAELVEALRDAGHDVVQTTVSRDVAELGLVKVRAASGRLVYAPPGPTPAERRTALRAALRRWALSFEATGNLVVVITPPGYASALAQALDEASHPSVAGTIAGDNTIFVAAREGAAAAALRDELHDHLLEGAA